jgi:short-subunit dehydrogenase
LRQWQGKRYWLIGASEGLGREVAFALSRAGAEVIISARSEDRLAELAAALPGKAQALPLDVSDVAAVRKAADDLGAIDGMVYLAGLYWPMKAQDWDADKAEAMMDVNLMGAVRAVGAVLPGMIARDAGHIVLTGSLSGFRGLPGTVGYGTSKAGMMYMAEGMYADLRGSGVDVQLINPGFIKTRMTDKNEFTMPFIMEPEAAARIFFEHMNSDDFDRSFPMVFSWLFRLSRFFPEWLYHRIFRK